LERESWATWTKYRESALFWPKWHLNASFFDFNEGSVKPLCHDGWIWRFSVAIGHAPLGRISTMSSETFFLQPLPPSNFVENWGDAKAVTLFSNYSQNPSAVATDAMVLTMIQGGAGAAIGAARSFFQTDANFSLLFSSSLGIADEGAYQITSRSEAKAVATFAVRAGQALSFDFRTTTISKGKEIDSPRSEMSQIASRSAFFIIETKANGQSKVIDYFGISGYLDSVNRDKLTFGLSENVRLTSRNKQVDLGGNNGEDFLIGAAAGSYRKTLRQDSQITIVEVTTATVALRGDTLIGSLGAGVTYGSIWDDRLQGTNNGDKIYGSLGNDVLNGRRGDDILEGGQGDDRLEGDEGDDRLYGGTGADDLIGGSGSDILVGGDGADRFMLGRGEMRAGEVDRIEDFQGTIDRVILQGFGITKVSQWWGQVVSGGLLVDTSSGALLTLSGSKVLFNGVAASSLGASDFGLG
jgi:serralysin